MKTAFYLAALALSLSSLQAARLKDLVTVEGVRDNQVVGYGIVVGLKGTGDSQQTIFSYQSLANLLARMGIVVSPASIQLRDIAAVLVTADLPPFGQPGSRLDVSVSAIGDAKNLQGGVLVLTPLKGADNQVYAVAQGSVVTGGFVAGSGGNTQTLNHPTSGRVPNGAIIEKAAPSVMPGTHIRLQLREADFTTAARIAEALNRQFSSGAVAVAHAESAGVVAVNAPEDYRERPVEFVAAVENVNVAADHSAKIVVDERTGTIVLGKDVRIAPVSILHGGLTVEIQTKLNVSQPLPDSNGKTAVLPDVKVAAKEEKARNVQLHQGSTVEDLVQALVAIGSTPRDIIAIIESLRAAGALEAEVQVI